MVFDKMTSTLTARPGRRQITSLQRTKCWRSQKRDYSKPIHCRVTGAREADAADAHKCSFDRRMAPDPLIQNLEVPVLKLRTANPAILLPHFSRRKLIHPELLCQLIGELRGPFSELHMDENYHCRNQFQLYEGIEKVRSTGLDNRRNSSFEDFWYRNMVSLIQLPKPCYNHFKDCPAMQ
jgi:hypothetical protein